MKAKLWELGKKLGICPAERSYFQQDIAKTEYLLAALREIGILALVAFLFYRSVIAFILLLPLGLRMFWSWERECVKKKQKEFLLEFKEAIASMAAAMQIGYSVENAIRATKKELALIYPEDTRIQKELSYMIQQIYLQVPTERIMADWADRVEMDDVSNFVNVFILARKSGGNMIGIIRNCVNQIKQKLEVKEEIDTLLAAKKYEFNVMTMIPFGMLAYMQLGFSEFMGSLYGNIVGIGVMSVCLVIYFTAYTLGRKIVDIDV